MNTIIENSTMANNISADDGNEETSTNSTIKFPLERKEYMAQFISKLLTLSRKLSEDLTALDIKWSLFVAAAESYRYEELLKPYPPQFIIKPNSLDIDRLLLVINLTPSLRTLLINIEEKNFTDCDPAVIDLLMWVLVDDKGPTFRTITNDDYAYLMHHIKQNINIVPPNHVFEILYEESDTAEKIFRSETQEDNFKFAFCGYGISYVYSVFHNSFNNTRVYVDELGSANNNLHLTTELAISVAHSPPIPCWGKSICGSVLRCVLLCEFANMTNYIRIQKDKKNEYEYLNIFIKKGDIVRPRFMIIYDDDKLQEKSIVKIDKVNTWYSRYKFEIFVGLSILGIFVLNFFHKKNNGMLMHGISSRFINLNS